MNMSIQKLIARASLQKFEGRSTVWLPIKRRIRDPGQVLQGFLPHGKNVFLMRRRRNFQSGNLDFANLLVVFLSGFFESRKAELRRAGQ